MKTEDISKTSYKHYHTPTGQSFWWDEYQKAKKLKQRSPLPTPAEIEKLVKFHDEKRRLKND